MADHYAFYHWKIKDGREDEFETAWAKVTEDGKSRCGSYGAVLTRCDDGTYAAFARWPDKESREKCWLGPESQTDEAKALLDCTENEISEVLMDGLDDKLFG